jgi:hypothetical protein
VSDDLGWKAMAVVAVGWQLHAVSLVPLRATCQSWLP